MSWWGKLAGGSLGFALGGPIGAMIGAMLGHQLDKSAASQPGPGGNTFDLGSQERTQAAFFAATFSVMGHIAKADGQVSPQEVQLAEQVMEEMQLNKEQRQAAIKLFNQGKQADFSSDDVLEQFRKECHRKVTLVQMFIEIQIQAAYADGKKHPAEERVLKHICSMLGYPHALLSQLESLIFAERRAYQHSGAQSFHTSPESELKNAYKILGVNASVMDAELKKAYRRLMSQHHPDKLISKGLPEEMIEIATKKAQEIQKAYDLVKEARKQHKAA